MQRKGVTSGMAARMRSPVLSRLLRKRRKVDFVGGGDGGVYWRSTRSRCSRELRVACGIRFGTDRVVFVAGRCGTIRKVSRRRRPNSDERVQTCGDRKKWRTGPTLTVVGPHLIPEPMYLHRPIENGRARVGCSIGGRLSQIRMGLSDAEQGSEW